MTAYPKKTTSRIIAGMLSVALAALAVGFIGMGSYGSSGHAVVIAAEISYPIPGHRIWPPETDPASHPPTTAVSERPQPPNAKPPQYKPPPPPPPKPKPDGTVAKNTADAVAAATSVGRSRGERVAVAVLDRHTGHFYGGGDVNNYYASASVMKVFIATRLLVNGQANNQATRDLMWRMIVSSDDDAARTLYSLAGGGKLIDWIVSRYGISGLAPTTVPGWWGLTRITARAMVNFYAIVATDQAVAPWLLTAMANARATAADGFHQYFGIPSATHSWRVKQGWMCCLDNKTRMHSTGFVNSDRFTVALLTEGSTGVYGNYGATTLTLMARALMPGGSIPTGSPPAPTPTPTSTGSPTPSGPASPPPSEPPSSTPSEPPTASP